MHLETSNRPKTEHLLCLGYTVRFEQSYRLIANYTARLESNELGCNIQLDVSKTVWGQQLLHRRQRHVMIKHHQRVPHQRAPSISAVVAVAKEKQQSEARMEQ